MRKEAIEAMAQYLVRTEESNARKVATQLATIYEQRMMLRPDTQTLEGKKRIVRYVTAFAEVDTPGDLDTRGEER